MDRKSKVLSWVIAIAVIASISITYYRTIIATDFVMTGEEVQAADEAGEESLGEIIEE